MTYLDARILSQYRKTFSLILLLDPKWSITAPFDICTSLLPSISSMSYFHCCLLQAFRTDKNATLFDYDALFLFSPIYCMNYMLSVKLDTLQSHNRSLTNSSYKSHYTQFTRLSLAVTLLRSNLYTNCLHLKLLLFSIFSYKLLTMIYI